MYCSKCGTKNDEESLFCGNCGEPFTKAALNEVKLVDEPERRQKSAVVSPKRNQYIVMSLIALAIVIAIATGAFLGSSRGSTQKQSQKSTQETTLSTETFKNQISLDLQISQIDNSDFPNIALYTKILGSDQVDLLTTNKQNFSIKEIGPDGKTYEATISDIVPIGKSNEMNINLVLDQSGSMEEQNKIGSVKEAATRFLTEILKSDKNSIEITSFDNYVYNVQPFTSNYNDLKNAVNSISPDGQTALFDAIYDALIQTNQQKGSRYVVAFTDGAENASLHSENEVVELSRLTGIPVYIIGIGTSTDYSTIDEFAVRCNGEYYNVDVANLSEMLLEIYDRIYQTQRNLYKISYTSTSETSLKDYRTVFLSSSKKGRFSGSTELDYMPKDTIASINNAKLASIISSRTAIENVAIAIVDLETSLEYRVGNARKSYVASGFYAPVYTVASSQNQNVANQMMSQMDNGAGNLLIDSFGGLSAINRELSQNGYTQTTFNRKFGDVAASNQGLENYTSAVDSAKILRDIYHNNGYKQMQWDLTKDGIILPKDGTFHAHRGQGIGAAYNVFAIVTSGNAKYGIAIMTAYTGSTDAEAKAVAVPMISEILAEVHKEMVGN